MIDVRMPDILAERARSGEMRLRLAYEEGMRAGDVVTREGFRGEEAQAILTMVNGEQRPHSQPLDDGDTVELVIPMVGGCEIAAPASARRHRRA
ncbi:MAG: MoaD/ThiS family protein [Chloroflexi bacterium]|nr:MoaD/ThiS family protein [Chloroflexota bacterium]